MRKNILFGLIILSFVLAGCKQDAKEEKEAFELLIGVNGIGPKVGLSVLSTLSVYELKMAVISEDVKTNF